MVFAKAKEPGRVMTRLHPVLGPEGASELHGVLVRRALETAHTVSPGATELWWCGEDANGFIASLGVTFGLPLRRQTGADLGARMRHALEASVSARGAGVLMGSDCPELTPEDLRRACAALARGFDAVLGPARDGGYVLIGLSRPIPGLFEDMPWGTGEVLSETRGRLRKGGHRWYELEMKRDLDRPEDLDLIRLLAPVPPVCAVPGPAP